MGRPRPLPLLDFIPALSPKWWAPRHLSPLARAFERTETERVFAFGTTPPRHGKTELVKHAIVRRLLVDPSCRICFVTFSQRYTDKRSREIRSLYLKAGGTLAPDGNRLSDWRTGVEQGGVWATSANGPVTGEGFDLIVIDDPIKGRAEAESGVEREKLWDWYNSDLETRSEPPLGSVIVIHTRWTTDDLGARLLARGDVEHIHIPAISPKGEALWPERFNLAELETIKKKRGPYVWQSLYMGAPFARGGRVFHDTVFYDDLPAKLRIAIGIDLAYSKKSHADYSTAVVLGFDDDTGEETPTCYVLEVIRVQLEAPAFIDRLTKLQHDRDGADLTWYYAGTEKGIADVMRTLGLEIDARPASADKHTRAQPVAAAWNAGKVLLPREAEWLDDFTAEAASFTGVDDVHDDQIDALAAGFDAGQQPGWIGAMQKWRARGGNW
jgi:predicted phage terminase large subunit-like protein